MIKIWTDGSCSPNPGPGGWGYVIVYPTGRENKGCGGVLQTTNNAMEILAAIQALSIFTKPQNIVLTTDSMYVKNGITKWVTGWISRNWKTSNGEEVANKDLWKRLHTLNKYHNVIWEWTKGHASDEYNGIADSLAEKGRQKALKQPNRHESLPIPKLPLEGIRIGLNIAIDWHARQCKIKPKRKRFHEKCIMELRSILE